jgi:hypothetical protein
MSFAMTTAQFLDGSKDVTRRCGWDFLSAGDLLWGVEKAMGLKKGEKINRLGLIEVVSARAEMLQSISAEDVAREGFPQMSREEFISFFCTANEVTPETIVNRIEFAHVGQLLAERTVCPYTGHLVGEAGDLAFSSSALGCSWQYGKDFLVGAPLLRTWLGYYDLLAEERAAYHRALNYCVAAGVRKCS